MKITHPQTLLIDADDTLWENNVYFENAIADFLSFLNHREMTHEQVREVLNEVERQTILQHGYGLHSFAHSLVTTFERLSLEPVTPELHQRIWKFAHRISEYPMEIIEGVAETLDYLQQREHHLILVTKGNITEQTGKIERSGLKDYFAAVEIVVEKKPVGVPRCGEQIRTGRGAHVDDRQQPKVRHQFGPGSGHQRCFRSA